MQQEERKSPFPFQLRDGRVLDLCTDNGVNTFLQAGSESRECLANDVKRMSKICSKRRLNTNDKIDLNTMNWFFWSIAVHGSCDVFRQHVEQSTVKAWLDHVIRQIKRFSTNRNWINTGKLPPHEISLLQSCIAMMEHAVPVALAFEREFFNVLADFVKARKGTGRALPCADICEMVTFIVACSYVASTLKFDNTWTTEKSLTKLEATGVLEQFIRCVTVPRPKEYGLSRILDEFQTCLPFISKKVRPGQPCGDVIIAILEGRDGSRVKRPSVWNRLETMIRFASSIDPNHNSFDMIQICRNCRMSDRPELLMKCARCKTAHYCSKECQKAHWKTHKKTCVPTKKKDLAMSENIYQTLMAFSQHQYVHIMVKMVEVCEQTGLSKNDMVVELNIAPNENGIVPAMQDKPELNIAPVKDYVKGPDWLDKEVDRDMYECQVKVCVAAIKEAYTKMEDSRVLYLVGFNGGIQVQLYEPENKEYFSPKAVLAFKAYMDDGNDGPLSEIFEPDLLKKLKWQLALYYGYGELDEEMVQVALGRALRKTLDHFGLQ